MLTPRRRLGKSDAVSWKVEWRLGGTRAGAPQSVTYSEVQYPDGEAIKLANRSAQLVEAHLRKIDRDQVYMEILGLPAAGPAVPTLNAVFKTWADSKVGIEENTLAKYRQNWAAHLSASLGTLPVDAVGREQIAGWVKVMTRKPSGRSGGTLSAATIQRQHALLHQVLEWAAVMGHLVANPARRTGLPKTHHEVTEERRVFFTSEEAERFLAAFRSDFARDLVTVKFGTGMRWSEITALQHKDIDDSGKTATLAVHRVWKKGKVVGAPKSRRSRRHITITPEILAILVRIAEKKKPAEYLFPGKGKYQLDSGNFTRDHWKPALIIAKGWDKKGRPIPRSSGLLLPDFEPRLHSCRHTHAAWLLSAGVPIARVSRRLGHESVSTTDRYYGHLAPSDDEDVHTALTDAMSWAVALGEEDAEEA